MRSTATKRSLFPTGRAGLAGSRSTRPWRTARFRRFFLSVVSFSLGIQIQAQDSPQSTTALEDWVARQIWVANIESGLPDGVNLSVSAVPDENDSGWQTFQLRSVHQEGSGFDPNVSPSMGIFRVNADRSMVEWLEPISGEWDSLSAFLQSMKADQPNAPPMTESTLPKEKPVMNPGNQLSADIDGDGKTETVRWDPVGEKDGDRFFSLEVVDDEGTILWTGPRELTVENDYVYFESHFGISLPQLFHDIDHDGNFDLLGPEPQSDVSPTYFRRLTWRDGAFFPRPSAALMMKDPEDTKLKWKEGDYSHGIWVSQFGPVTPEGFVQAHITDYGESGKWRGGIALIRFRRGGAAIEQWVRPLSPAE